MGLGGELDSCRIEGGDALRWFCLEMIVGGPPPASLEVVPSPPYSSSERSSTEAGVSGLTGGNLAAAFHFTLNDSYK